MSELTLAQINHSGEVTAKYLFGGIIVSMAVVGQFDVPPATRLTPLLTKPPGIHLFMCLYSISVYFESTKDQRKGRGRYIAIGFAILVLFGLSASLDAYTNFRMLWFTTEASGYQYITLAQAYDVFWFRILSTASTVAMLLICDGLLVCPCMFRDQLRG